MTRRPGAFGGAIVLAVALLAIGCSENTEKATSDRSESSDRSTNQRPDPAPAWSTEPLDFASRPAKVGDHLVAYLAVDGQLALAAFDPETGSEVWRRDSTASSITPGVALSVESRGSTVLNLKPVDPAESDHAHVEAVDANTGEQLWESSDAIRVVDPLDSCDAQDGNRSRRNQVCVTMAESYARVAFDLADGSWTRLPAKDLGRSLGEGLYDSGDAIVYVRNGDELWRSTPRKMFRGRNVDPDHGWSWDRHGDQLIGTLGRVPADGEGPDPDAPVRTYHLTPDDELTAGIDVTNGENVWLEPGDLWCGNLGDLDLVNTIRCKPSGTVTYASNEDDSSEVAEAKVDVEIERFSPEDGTAEWSVTLAGFPGYEDPEEPLLRVDEHTFATVLEDGTAVAVDLRTGKKRQADEGTLGWCTEPNTYRYDRSYGDRPFRAGEDFAEPCRLNGDRAPLPSSLPKDFGTRIGDVFAWVDGNGMHAVRTGRSG